jgi:phospholipid-binding lipoprotein MlaA
MLISRSFQNAALALIAMSAVSFAADVRAANKLYDMNQMMDQGNPLDVRQVPQSVPQPARAPQAAQPSDSRFGSQLYDMDRMLNERNPFDRSPPPLSSQRQSAPMAAPIEVAQTPNPPPSPAPTSSRDSTVKPATGSDPGFPNLDEEYDPGQMAGDVDGRDPLEPLNRAIFGFNEFVYEYLLTPAARGYNKVVPELARESLSNTIDNLKGPVTLANDILQLEPKRAGTTIVRFVINSTLGFFGTMDPASELGFAKHSEDFGQTMGSYGVGEGFYLVLPLLGPSNPRDAIGKLLVDGYFDPLGYYLDNTDNENWGYVRSGVSGFDEYAGIVDDLDNLRQTSVDFYGALRSLYRQRRAAEIRNQEQGAVPAIGGR